MNILKTATILAIDDDPQILSLLGILLEGKCKAFIPQQWPEQAVELAEIKQPDLILLDVVIGNVSGYDICKQLKENPQTEQIPVIFLSSLAQPDDKVKGFNAGGVDYISKPFDVIEVIARIDSCLATHKKIELNLHNHAEKIAEVLRQYHFNRREIQILHFYISGHKRKDIATKIFVSESTVKWYLKQIFQKLEVHSRAALLEKVRELEL